MAVPPPSSSFVAFPPAAEAGRVFFGKNSTRPRDEVQEVVYFPCAEYEPGAQVEVRVERGAQVEVGVERGAQVEVRDERGAQVEVGVERGAQVEVRVERGVQVEVRVERGAQVEVRVERGAQVEVRDERGAQVEVGVERGAQVEVRVERGAQVEVRVERGAQVEVRVERGAQAECTYITINQAQRTHAVVLSRPAWLWGAEMGANEHGVCIANAAVVAREPGARTEALLGMDLVRLGVERGSTAKVALDTIVSLLEEHGQGGNYFEDRNAYQAFHSAFLIADRVEGWVLETVGKYWAAERITEGFKGHCQHLSITTNIDAEHPELRSYAQEQGWWSEGQEFNFSEVFSLPNEESSPCAGKEFFGNQEGDLTVQTVIDALRDKETGVCVDSESLLTTASMVSVLPQSTASPCVHFFTATPDPARSIFKPFIFVDDVKLVPQAQSPSYGEGDPVKLQPRFESKVDRRHELYKAHEWALTVIDSEEMLCLCSSRADSL
ncbi:UNVERIFIED_CONTAM: hypothetical protein FKN15_034573 [Acipenser sinensis]